MAYGIKVSKPGESVFIAGTKDLFMDTSYPLLKVESSGSGSLSVSDGSNDSDTVSHNLGYIPKVLVYGEYYSLFTSAKTEHYYRYPVDQLVSTTTSGFGYTIDSSDLVIKGGFDDGSSNSDTFNYFYYIFYNEY